MVTNTIHILGFKASVLFDLKATHSFVSSVFVKLTRLAIRPLEVGLVIATLVRNVGNTLAKKCLRNRKYLIPFQDRF
jgi:hypothetical protein